MVLILRFEETRKHTHEPGDLGVGQLKAPEAEFPPQRVALISNDHEQRLQGNRQVARCGVTSSYECKLEWKNSTGGRHQETPAHLGVWERNAATRRLYDCLR